MGGRTGAAAVSALDEVGREVKAFWWILDDKKRQNATHLRKKRAHIGKGDCGKGGAQDIVRTQ